MTRVVSGAPTSPIGNDSLLSSRRLIPEHIEGLLDVLRRVAVKSGARSPMSSAARAGIESGEVILYSEPDTTFLLRLQNMLLSPSVPEQEL